MKKAFFVIAILLVVVVIVAPQESDNVASADMGPKPSVVVTFEHLDKECYVTLLSSEKSTGPHSVFDEEYGSFDELYGESKEKEIYAKFINYKDKDNYYFLQVLDNIDVCKHMITKEEVYSVLVRKNYCKTTIARTNRRRDLYFFTLRGL